MKTTLQQGSTARRVIAQPLPNSFAGLMEMYEGNYIRLRKLLGDKNKIPEIAVSRIANGMDLYLQVLEQTKYTSTIALTYYFSEGPEGFAAYPNLKIRIYYDALQAEVMNQAFRHKNKPHRADSHAFNHLLDPTLLKRWRMNRFLYKWLHFCHRQGHSFNRERENHTNQLVTKNVEIPLQQGATSSTIFK